MHRRPDDTERGAEGAEVAAEGLVIRRTDDDGCDSVGDEWPRTLEAQGDRRLERLDLGGRHRHVEREKREAAQARSRKLQVGSGDRSERIRTYNFPQGRITDHRINLTLYKIDAMMDGDIDDLCNALASEHQAELLAALSDN